jgi:hypothetical protein
LKKGTEIIFLEFIWKLPLQSHRSSKQPLQRLATENTVAKLFELENAMVVTVSVQKRTKNT